MIALLGRDMDLAIYLTRNGQPLVGKNVFVSAVDVNSGATVLAEEQTTEVSPALYRYVWPTIDQPSTESTLLAKFRLGLSYFSEEIQVFESLGGGSGGASPGDIYGLVDDDDAIAGTIAEEGIVGILDEDSIIASVEDEEVVAVLSDESDLTGVVDDDGISGTVGC